MRAAPDQVPIVEASTGIASAVEHLRAGHVVAYPTETLYGLAVDALNQDAVMALLDVKGRGACHPIPCIVSDRAALALLVDQVPEDAERLIRAHWPGPLTLVLPAVPGVPSALVNEEGGVGVRVSSDPVASELTQRYSGPLTATSANLSGDAPATSAEDATLSGVALVLDGGVRRGRASTVVEVMPGHPPRVLRQGAINISAEPWAR